MRDQYNRYSQILFSDNSDSTVTKTHSTITMPTTNISSSTKSGDVKGQPDTYEKMLTLDSIFYQPNRWQSKYVRKLTTALSIKDSRQRMLQSGNNSQATVSVEYPNGSCSVTVPQYCEPYCQCQCRTPSARLQESTRRRARPTTIYFANDGIRTSTGTQSHYHNQSTANQCQLQTERRTDPFVSTSTNIMSIQAAHQFSTIKTIYNDDRRTYEGIVQPHKPMLVQVDFEVIGEVSGVYFMKYAKSMCDTLDIRGWIRVSPRGTVYGQLQGEKTKVDEITLWLKMQGSPKSKVAGCEFRNWHLIDSCNFRSFTIRY